MIASMTGFARREVAGSWGTLTCELRSKNDVGTNEDLEIASDTNGAGNHTLAIAQVNQFGGAGKGGYYVLACQLPAGHSIRSYYVYEH